MTTTEFVHVTVINHRHGENVYVNRTDEGRDAEVVRWAGEWWEGLQDMFEDWPAFDSFATPMDAARYYFEHNEREYVEIHESVIGP
jgi:hypothetical protein